MTKETIIEFIKRNAARMSYKSLSEETGLSIGALYNLCGSEGVRPISQYEESVVFIKEWKGRMSIEKILKVLGIDDRAFKRICYNAGVSLKDFSTEAQKQSDKMSV